MFIYAIIGSYEETNTTTLEQRKKVKVGSLALHSHHNMTSAERG